MRRPGRNKEDTAFAEECLGDTTVYILSHELFVVQLQNPRAKREAFSICNRNRKKESKNSKEKNDKRR